MLISLVMATALVAGSDPDGVITTAPEDNQSVLVGATAPVVDTVPTTSATQTLTPHGLTTDEQIDRWLAQRSAEDRPFAEDDMGLGDDREIHGEVSAEIGTGDYSAYSASVSLPVGETGRVDLSYSQSRNGYRAYPGYGYSGYGHPTYGYSGYVYPGQAYSQQSFGIGYRHGDPVRARAPFSVTRRERVFEQRDSDDVLRLAREPVTADD